ncbi:helix-turn-helix domain-containing protein [Paenibacillus harenae]|uniref:helix-turn-helix domain-containing protein n=1 Tax=Paenibacillus harenae TaxID=306543 RepID=UPI0009FEB766|nr:helix-turn-helix transcriptional regulator [Paenibacillus harenae]
MHFSRGECLLRYWLKKRGITQAELSRRTGWSTRMISYWCNDERPMSAEAMYTAATILDIRMEQLYHWKLEASESRRTRI